jgi:hypothetical protein
MVSEGQLDIDDVIPCEVQDALAEACEAMDQARLDYRNPRPGYLQSAMRFCPDGTNWDHLAMYLAQRRRQAAIDDLDDVDLDEVERFTKTQRRRERGTASSANPSSDTVAESLALFQAGKSVEEIAAERELKPITVEGHLVTAIGAGRLALNALVDEATIALVRAAIDQTPPSDTPLRDIRATAIELAGRDISYVAINAVRAVEGDGLQVTGDSKQPAAEDEDETPSLNGADAAELQDLLDRKAKADQLKARHAERGKPWPAHWEDEYRRIVGRIAELRGRL